MPVGEVVLDFYLQPGVGILEQAGASTEHECRWPRRPAHRRLCGVGVVRELLRGPATEVEPASGPNAIPIATARFSSTPGEVVNASYSAAMRDQSVSAEVRACA